MPIVAPHTEGKIDRDGIKLHYNIYGDGPQTILFAPTWSMVDSRCWNAQVPYFAEHFRVVTYDPRGNGKSDRPAGPEGYAADDMIDDVLAVMDATGTQKAILVGLSTGSWHVLTVAAYYPERVEAVISTGANTPLIAPFEGRFESFASPMPENPRGWDKFNGDYWRKDYADFLEFFLSQCCNEPHSSKLQEKNIAWALESDGDMLNNTMLAPGPERYVIDEAMHRRIVCPCLFFVGDKDTVTPPEGSRLLAELTGGRLIEVPGAGHTLHGRYAAMFNKTVRDFLAEHLGTYHPVRKPKAPGAKRVLYLSSPIGLGHARRDLAIARELRKLHPGLQVDWLAQDPVTRLLGAHGENIHPASNLMASESAHIEESSRDHDLHVFEAFRSMDEILIKNFMVFQEAVEEGAYDLVIADEAWDVDHFWHEHPELKKAQVAWLTDFVGFVPFEENGACEAALTADYNLEMLEHVERNPDVRDRAIFVGTEEDIINDRFGDGLPRMRDWIPQNYTFSDYVIGQHPSEFGSRDDLRAEFGYDDGRVTCLVAVGGSGVGASLIRRILKAYPLAKARLPDLRMIVVVGPRLDPATFNAPVGVEMRAFVPDLDRHFASCDLALVQGGLTTCMELTAAGTPFLYFPLRNHFEQNFHVAHRLERYNSGRKMVYAKADPERIAEAMVSELTAPRRPHPVARDGAARVAHMLQDML